MTQQSYTAVNFYGIPSELKDLDVWALYSTQKFPVTAAAVYKGWPITRLDDAGAQSNNPNTFAPFELIQQAYNRKSNEVVHGPSFCLTPGCGYVVFDLDKPKLPREKFENDETFEAYKAAVNRINKDILAFFSDTFAEESMSGNGFHMFIRGSLPQGVSQYKMITGGNIFTERQFIHMTGSCIAGHPLTISADQQRLTILIESLVRDGIIKPIDPKDDPKSESNVALLHEQSTQYGRRLDLTDDQVIERLLHRGQKIVETYCGTGLGFTSDWSEGTQILIGELDKITGDAGQVERVLFASPRMQTAGVDARGTDRNTKIARVFRDNFIKARLQNDKVLAARPINDPVVQKNMAVILSGPGSQQFKQKENIAVSEKVAERLNSSPVASSKYSKEAIIAVQEIMGELPERYMQECAPPGMAGEYVAYAYQAMYEPILEFSIASTLAMLAGINARRCKLQDGQGPVMSFIIAAGTGVGKNQALDSWKTLINNVISGTPGGDGNEHIDGLRVRPRHRSLAVASRAGLTGLLMDQGCFVDCVDECEPALKVLATQQGDKAEMLMQSFRLQAFDICRANEGYNADVSVEAQKRGDKTVFNVCVSTLWATTIEKAKRYIDSDFLSAGFGSRMLFILYDGVSGKNQKLKDVRRSLPRGQARRYLEIMLQMADELDDFYVEAQIQTPNVIPTEYWKKITIIKSAPGVDDAIEALLDRMNAFKAKVRIGSNELPSHYSAFNRVGMLAPRVAALLAIADNPLSPIMTLEHFYWALGYVLQKNCKLTSAFDKKDFGVTLGDAQEAVINLMKRMLIEPEYKNGQGIELYTFNKRLKRIKPFTGELRVNELAKTAIYECIEMGLIKADERPTTGGRIGRVLYPTTHEIWDV